VIAAIVVTVAMEALRFLDSSLNFIFFQTPPLPGLRMVVFSVLLLLVIIFRQQGLMGKKEFSWNLLFDSRLGKKISAVFTARSAGGGPRA
jgi:branched-chain amino acid transport system permease protein